MYWGIAAAASESDGAAVFSPNFGYQAVFHFTETGGAGQHTERDPEGHGGDGERGDGSGPGKVRRDEAGLA
jgi:hypothetical protein